MRAAPRVLVVGAGLVAAPLVEELLDARREPRIELHLAALEVERARRLAAPHGERATAHPLDVTDAEALAGHVREADLVVSLLPAPLHPRVAEACLAHRVPLVTTSYVSDAMGGLDTEARERGVLLLNECGLDPGIDHLMAMRVFRRVAAAGRVLRGYVSYAGGLPAPESNTNPWGYKLSWSPRAVLTAAKAPVRFLAGGAVVTGTHPFTRLPPPLLDVAGVGSLEIYPNRDSLPYRDLYGLEEAETVFRGTLRYPGWCATFRALLNLGLLSEDPPLPTGATWQSLMAGRLPGTGPLKPRLLEHLAGVVAPQPVFDIVDRLEWLGLLTDEPLPPDVSTPLDGLARRLGNRLLYEPGERDLITLVHRFVVEDPETEERRILESRLLVTGEAGDHSAMARTVGLPTALAARRILAGEVDETGVRIPVSEAWVEPLLAGLEERGIPVEEKEVSTTADPGSPRRETAGLPLPV